MLPDVVTYNTALGVIARSGREDVALALLDHMKIDGESAADSLVCLYAFLGGSRRNAAPWCLCKSQAFPCVIDVG